MAFILPVRIKYLIKAGINLENFSSSLSPLPNQLNEHIKENISIVLPGQLIDLYELNKPQKKEYHQFLDCHLLKM